MFSPALGSFVTTAVWLAAQWTAHALHQGLRSPEPLLEGPTAVHSGQTRECLAFVSWQVYKGRNTSMCRATTDMMHLTLEVALTTLSICPSLYPPFSQSLRTFWERCIMPNFTRRRTSCESALRRICRHTVRFSTSDGGKCTISSIWKQRWFRKNALYAEVLNVNSFPTHKWFNN